jgi:hypothetical protein
VDPFPVGIHGQASASHEIWARDGSSFDGPKGVIGTIFMEAPTRVAIQTFHQPTNQPTNHVHTTNHQSPITNDMFHDMFVH